MFFTGLEVRTELFLSSAAAREICRREGVGTIRQLSTKVLVLWLQQLVTRGVVSVAACTSAENRADLGTKSLPAHTLRRLRQWNGLVLERNENPVTGDRRWTRRERAAGSCSANNLRSWAKRRRSPGRTREFSDGFSWDEVSIWSDARCNTTSGNWSGLSGTLRNGLSRGHTSV